MDRIYLKPKAVIYFFLVLGLAIIILTRNIPGIITGLVFSSLSLYNIFFIKDRIIVEIYQDYLIIMDNYDPLMCYKVSYDDIETYTQKAVNSTSVYVFHLRSGEVLEVPSANGRIYQRLRKMIPEKDQFTKWKNDLDQRNKARKAQKNKGQ
ncbi:hypothetical protein SDC9_211129 [bioreactor metagenome]|uniref:Uncharacterized protein n=1 Tax=bioreactor metagenome TaxID=1076179 RepID=A0A645JID2_9ZZZZ